MNNVDQDSQGHLYVLSPRGYSAYEIAVQQGFVGTEDEWLASLVGPEGETGATPNIQIGTVITGSSSSVTRTGTDENPILNFVLEKGDKGETGETGNGIASIIKTGSIGLVDTYTITYTNGQTTTFTVTNGEDGEVTQAQLDETNVRVERAELVYNALPKVSGKGTDITLDDTAECPMKLELEPSELQQRNLPVEYTQVDYIQSSGTQYIDTGYTFINATQKLEFNFTPLLIGDYRVCGSYISGHKGMIVQPRQTNMIEVGSLSITPDFDMLVNTNYEVYLEAKNGSYDFKLNSNTKTGSYGSRDAITNLSHYIFGVHQTSGITNAASMNLYYYKMYDNDVLVRDMIPCYRNSDNEVGLYDLVNGVFYTNAGTGVFTYGNIATPNPSYPQRIHTINGDNTITISNSNDSLSQVLSLALDDVEYCKIDEYADRIFKNISSDIDYDNTLQEGKWYIKKNILKTTDVTESTGKTISDMISDSTVYSYYGGTVSGKTITYSSAIGGTNTIYYPTTTPTYSLLDSTLQTQLDNVYERALSYQEQTKINQVNDDLPFILTVEAVYDLNKLLQRVIALE